MDSLLSPYRALDLTDEKGFLCGEILGDLGADVIKVERPGGDLSRNIGPFYHDIPDPEKSLYWLAYNTSKRGITLKLETPDGQDLFRKLVKKADFVIESFPPGYLDGLNLGYSELCKVNPRIILTSITPFGQRGPYQDYKASDLVAMAMSGQMYICGDPDRPPVRFSFPQSYHHAGVHAAAGTMIALYYRELTGEGQHVDVSLQEAVAWTVPYVQQFWDLDRRIIERRGAYCESLGGRLRRQTWPCQDGYVSWRFFPGVAGPIGGMGTRRLVEAMNSEGLALDLKGMKWEEMGLEQLTQEQIYRWEELFGEYFRRHTKAELQREAMKRGFVLFGLNTAEDVLRSEQLAAREYWVQVEHPELGDTITYPGAFLRSTETCWRISRPAPLIGQHNEEIFMGELKLSREEFLLIKQGGII